MSKEKTAKPTITKNALSKAVTEKVAEKKSATKKVAAKKKSVTVIEPQLRYEMIIKMAYFRAKERYFEPGHEVNDWLESEKQIDRILINK